MSLSVPQQKHNEYLTYQELDNLQDLIENFERKTTQDIPAWAVKNKANFLLSRIQEPNSVAKSHDLLHRIANTVFKYLPKRTALFKETCEHHKQEVTLDGVLYEADGLLSLICDVRSFDPKFKRQLDDATRTIRTIQDCIPPDQQYQCIVNQVEGLEHLDIGYATSEFKDNAEILLSLIYAKASLMPIQHVKLTNRVHAAILNYLLNKIDALKQRAPEASMDEEVQQLFSLMHIKTHIRGKNTLDDLLYGRYGLAVIQRSSAEKRIFDFLLGYVSERVAHFEQLSANLPPKEVVSEGKALSGLLEEQNIPSYFHNALKSKFSFLRKRVLKALERPFSFMDMQHLLERVDFFYDHAAEASPQEAQAEGNQLLSIIEEHQAFHSNPKLSNELGAARQKVENLMAFLQSEPDHRLITDIKMQIRGMDIEDSDSPTEEDPRIRINQRLKILMRDFKNLEKAGKHNYSRIEIIEALKDLEFKVLKFKDTYSTGQAPVFDLEETDHRVQEILTQLNRKITEHTRAHQEYAEALGIYNTLDQINRNYKCERPTANDLMLKKEELRPLYKWTKENGALEFYLFADEGFSDRIVIMLCDNERALRSHHRLTLRTSMEHFLSRLDSFDVDFDGKHIKLRELTNIPCLLTKDICINDRFCAVSLVTRPCFVPGDVAHAQIVIERTKIGDGRREYEVADIEPQTWDRKMLPYATTGKLYVYLRGYDRKKLGISEEYKKHVQSKIVYKTWLVPRERVECLLSKIDAQRGIEPNLNDPNYYDPEKDHPRFRTLQRKPYSDYVLCGRDYEGSIGPSARCKSVANEFRTPQERLKFIQDHPELIDGDHFSQLRENAEGGYDRLIPADNCLTWATEMLRSIGIDDIGERTNPNGAAIPAAYQTDTFWNWAYPIQTPARSPAEQPIWKSNTRNAIARDHKHKPRAHSAVSFVSTPRISHSSPTPAPYIPSNSTGGGILTHTLTSNPPTSKESDQDSSSCFLATACVALAVAAVAISVLFPKT